MKEVEEKILEIVKEVEGLTQENTEIITIIEGKKGVCMILARVEKEMPRRVIVKKMKRGLKT
jgi:hypothetical protein